MRVLLIAAVIIPFAYIGYLLSRLDIYLHRGKVDTDMQVSCHEAIVMGVNEWSDKLIRMLNRNHVSVLSISEPNFSEQMRTSKYLFAMTDNDADNLMMCKIGRKVYGIEKVICICNDIRNEAIFTDERIPYIAKERVSEELLFNILVEDRVNRG